MKNALPLGRPRTFATEDALQAALQLFWRHGYQAASLDDLTRVMGLSRSSFYAAFRSKQNVLLMATRVYVDGLYARLQACIVGSNSGAAAVRAMLDVLADPDGDERGCLLVNSITEVAPDVDALTELAREHIDRVMALLTSQLQRSGMSAEAARVKAATSLSCGFGIAVMRKAGVETEILAAALRQLDELVCSAETEA